MLACLGLLSAAWPAGMAAIAAGAEPSRPSASAPVKGARRICFALYTVQDRVLKLTAQLYPDHVDPGADVSLEIERNGTWKTAGRARPTLPGWTAHFRVENWDDTRDARYRVRSGPETYAGLIRRNPVEKETIVAAAFTGNSPGPGGGRVNKHDVVEYVAKLDPDVLLFTGDQVYNHHQHTTHWLHFGEDFGGLIRNRPTVTIPDDHDVGHPNLWGAGGRPCEKDSDGGYLKPPEYVNMVQRQQTAHLPDPYDPTPVQQGITVYYTSLNIGGIDFAIIEDRKFKSGCKGLVTPELGPRPDHITSPDYDPADFDRPEFELLGERQHKFLREWSLDWKGAVMKCVVSQTLFSMVSTYHSKDKALYYADFDANGWPQTGRNQAIDLMRRCFAFHICGDQHLGTIVQYGIEDWRDAGYAFCVPSIANYYPRWWIPTRPAVKPSPGGMEYTGDFLDGFGNRMTVYAHTNPRTTGRRPAELHDRTPGWGIVRFNKAARTITMECWPRMVDPVAPDSRQYEGWPRTIRQLDNYARKPAAWLPTLEVSGAVDPVVIVFDEAGELVYALRISGTRFRPWVFADGIYHVKIGLPEKNTWREMKVEAMPPGNVEHRKIDLAAVKQ